MVTTLTQLDQNGFVILPQFLSDGELGRLEQILPPVHPATGGLRNLLDIPPIAELAEGEHMRHQDLTIAVRERRDMAGYGPWTSKQGVVHVQPPAAVLEQTLAVRLHVDDSGAGNGPLRVLPGSHRAGKLRDEDIPAWQERLSEEVCLVPRGGALVMRPLLLHASSPATEPRHRRVLHIEYASCELPAGLEWRWAKRSARAA